MKLSLATQELFEMTNMKDIMDFDATEKVKTLGKWTDTFKDYESWKKVWG